MIIFLDKQDFEKVLHGNRSIHINDKVIVGHVYTFICNDTYYSYPVDAKIKSYYPAGDVYKTNKAIRTSNFPFK